MGTASLVSKKLQRAMPGLVQQVLVYFFYCRNTYPELRGWNLNYRILESIKPLVFNLISLSIK